MEAFNTLELGIIDTTYTAYQVGEILPSLGIDGNEINWRIYL
jgi:hypothetical protein